MPIVSKESNSCSELVMKSSKPTVSLPLQRQVLSPVSADSLGIYLGSQNNLRVSVLAGFSVSGLIY